MKKSLLILTSAAAMIGLAAPAYADNPPSGHDADFIKQLNAAGLTDQDPTKAIAVAKDMCGLFDKGTPEPQIQSSLVSLNPGLTQRGAADFMTLAAGEYCPKYLTGQNKPPNAPPAPPAPAGS
jgi:hypothetical protein